MVPRRSREVALKQKADWWTGMAYELAYIKAKIPSRQSLQALHMNYQRKQWIKHHTCLAAAGEIQKRQHARRSSPIQIKQSVTYFSSRSTPVARIDRHETRFHPIQKYF
jgi:hypothetical protein